MWPPMPGSFLFWPCTMAMAFQRIRLSTRRSRSRIAGIGHFLMLGNGIQVGSGQLARRVDAGLARALAQCRQQLGAMLGPLRDNDVVKGLDPLRYLFGKACLGWHCLFLCSSIGSTRI